MNEKALVSTWLRERSISAASRLYASERFCAAAGASASAPPGSSSSGERPAPSPAKASSVPCSAANSIMAAAVLAVSLRECTKIMHWSPRCTARSACSYASSFCTAMALKRFFSATPRKRCSSGTGR